MIRDVNTQVVDAIKAQFPATVAAWPRVYLVGERPPIPTDETEQRAFFPFVTVWPFRRAGSDTRRLSDDSGVTGFRIVTMCVGRYAAEVAYAEEKVAVALDHKRLTIATYSSTPIRHESGAAAELDPTLDEWITSTNAWTFVATKQQAA